MRCRRHSLPLGQTSVPDRLICSSLPARCDIPSARQSITGGPPDAHGACDTSDCGFHRSRLTTGNKDTHDKRRCQWEILTLLKPAIYKRMLHIASPGPAFRESAQMARGTYRTKLGGSHTAAHSAGNKIYTYKYLLCVTCIHVGLFPFRPDRQVPVMASEPYLRRRIYR